MTKRSDELISVVEAAKIIGVSPTRVRSFIEGKRLAALKVGRAFVVRRVDAEGFERREPGRPKR